MESAPGKPKKNLNEVINKSVSEMNKEEINDLFSSIFYFDYIKANMIFPQSHLAIIVSFLNSIFNVSAFEERMHVRIPLDKKLEIYYKGAFVKEKVKKLTIAANGAHKISGISYRVTNKDIVELLNSGGLRNKSILALISIIRRINIGVNDPEIKKFSGGLYHLKDHRKAIKYLMLFGPKFFKEHPNQVNEIRVIFGSLQKAFNDDEVKALCEERKNHLGYKSFAPRKLGLLEEIFLSTNASGRAKIMKVREARRKILEEGKERVIKRSEEIWRLVTDKAFDIMQEVINENKSNFSPGFTFRTDNIVLPPVNNEEVLEGIESEKERLTEKRKSYIVREIKERKKKFYEWIHYSISKIDGETRI